MSQELSPRWQRLKKSETIQTGNYTVDCYRSPLFSGDLIAKYLDEEPVLYNFAVFDAADEYLLSYALEIRTAVRVDAEENETEYTGYFLETYCPYRKFSCKNFKETEPTYEAVKTTVFQFINEYDAVPKMLEYDREVEQKSRLDANAQTGAAETGNGAEAAPDAE